MNTLLRTTLLAVFAACGVATAIALALQEPPPKKPTAPRRDAAQAPVPAAVAPATPRPVVAEYRDPVANQISLLDAAISKTRELVQETGQQLEQKIADVADKVAEQPLPPPPPAPAADAPAQPAPPEREPLATLSADRLTRGEGDNSITLSAQNTDIRKVLELLAEGLPNKGIADRLGISDQTVKFHIASIMGKLGASNRVETVRRAVRRGLLSL